jgi:hypothetical protein
MVAILTHPDAALTYIDAVLMYMDGALAHMDAALPPLEVACTMAALDLIGGGVSMHDESPQDLREIGCSVDGNKVLLTRDANLNSAKNRFLECFPEVRDIPLIVLVDETDEFLVLMDEICTPKRDPGAQVTWADEDYKSH